jgi:hypothetical protein
VAVELEAHLASTLVASALEKVHRPSVWRPAGLKNGSDLEPFFSQGEKVLGRGLLHRGPRLVSANWHLIGKVGS